MNAIYRCAELQYGTLTRNQALECGLTIPALEYLVKKGRLAAVFPSVYRIPGAPQTGRQRAMAATLWLGDESAISHLTGATLLRFDGCRATHLDASVPRTVRRRILDPGIRIHRVASLPHFDRTLVDGIPCTTATRTIIDCAPLLGEERLEVMFESARRMGLTSVDALARRAKDLCGRGRPGTRAVEGLLRHQVDGDRPLQFRLEVKMARLLRDSPLPRPVRQFEVGTFHIDFAYPSLRIGIECEGWEFHGNRIAWKRDKRRTAWLEAHGWRLLFVTWDDVTKRPRETLDRIVIALADPSAGTYDR